MSLTHLFRAVYKNGSAYDQTQEDVSVTELHLPLEERTKPAFFDVLKGEGERAITEIREFHLIGQQNENRNWHVDLETGDFYRDGILQEHGERPALKGNKKLIFFKTVRQHKVIPAIFRNPKNYGIDNGQRVVIDSIGQEWKFPENSRIFQIREEKKDENGVLLKDKHGNQLYDDTYEVFPFSDSVEVDYVLGWEALSAEPGKDGEDRNYKETVRI